VIRHQKLLIRLIKLTLVVHTLVIDKRPDLQSSLASYNTNRIKLNSTRSEDRMFSFNK